MHIFGSSPQENDVQAATKSLAETYARRTALSMTSAIVKVVTGLLINARDCLEDEKSFELLNRAPIITKLMPHILASISSLASSDPHSAVQVLSFIQEILPSVASLQNLYLLNQENDGLTSASETEEENAEAKNNEIEAASQHYAWVESEHPYKPASVNTYRVLFPASGNTLKLLLKRRKTVKIPSQNRHKTFTKRICQYISGNTFLSKNRHKQSQNCHITVT